MAQVHFVGFRKVTIEMEDDSVLIIETGDMILENQRLYSGPPEKYEIHLKLVVDHVTYSHLAPEQARIEYGPSNLASEGNKTIGAGEGNPRRLNRPSGEEIMDC